jgi:hypothetical protein
MSEIKEALESMAQFEGSWVRTHPDKAPQISYNKGETWEDIDFSEVESREFKVEIPSYIYTNAGKIKTEV